MMQSIKSFSTETLKQIEIWFTDGIRSSWGSSFLRILLGATLLVQLLVNFPFLNYSWGPASAWSQNLHASEEFLGQRLLFGPTSDLTVATIAYVLLLAATIAFLIGWHTRIATLTVLVLNTWLSFSDGIYMNQSDNFLRMALIYCLFMKVAEHWSIDAKRRKRKTTESRLRVTFNPYFNLLHNVSVTALGAHICLIYVASAMFKIQGNLWQNGTALYYPLGLPHYAAWPELNSLVEHSAIGIFIGTYAAVYFQLFFPFMLLNKYLRKIALLGIVAMHLGIAVLMGLPFFSFFMLAGDSIFVSSKTYKAVDTWVRKKARSFRKDKKGSQSPLSKEEAVLEPVA